MSWIHGLAHRISTLVRPRAYERELNDEMRFHVELDAMQQRDATRARRRFGNRTHYAEETREQTWLRLLDVVQQDARFAWRSLKRNPALTALIVMTFTLGIGVNAATFSVLDRIYLRPPDGVANPSQVHRVWIRHTRIEGKPRFSLAMTYPMFRIVRDTWGDSSQAMLVSRVSNYLLGGTRAGPSVDALFATSNYWSMLGLRPQLGRFFSADEDRLGAPSSVVVVSDHLWRDKLGADPNILGKTIRLDQERLTVIGVAPPAFSGTDLEPVDAWRPLASYPKPGWMTEPVWESTSLYSFQVYVRATPTSDLRTFDERATRAIQGYNRSLPKHEGDTLMTVAAGPIVAALGPGEQRQEHVLSTRLSAVALIVLLIASANIVNLLLARAASRRREIAVRLALGVARWRLVRMLTAETLLLALIAASASTLAAWWGATALRALLLPDVNFVDAAMGSRVVVFTFGLAVIAGLVAGVVPALQSSKPHLARALKETVRDGGGSRSRLRAVLVVVQTALSVLLVAGAVVFVKSLENVRGLDLGFDAANVVIATVNYDPGQAPPRPVQSASIEDIARRMASREGIVGVARAGLVPMAAFNFAQMWIDGDSVSAANGLYPIESIVTANYFSATGVRLLRGRTFADAPGASTEVVINEAMARQRFPGVDPLGHCMTFDTRMGTCYAIVGIAETARREHVIEDPNPEFYLPMTNLPPFMAKQWGQGTVLLVRAAPRYAPRVVAAVTQELKRAFPAGYPYVRLLSETLEPEYRPWRVGAELFTSFGALALVVAIVGIYSTVSYGVSQRTHDFGVRIALGAGLGNVLRLVIGESLRTVAVGALAGIVLALAAGRLVASLVYGTSPGNPFAIGGASMSLMLVAALAAFLPAWRAGRVDPATALRAD